MTTIALKMVSDHIAMIEFTREEAMNAFSFQLLDELNAALDEIEVDETIRTVVFTGQGQRAFSAGADLKERRGMNAQETIHAVQKIGDTINRIAKLKMPTIAAINGVAFGGGLELALACDMRLASVTAKMGLTETSLAIIPGAGGTQRLSRIVGVGQAKKLIFQAERLSAQSALDIGLIEGISEIDTLKTQAIDMAERIANNGPLAVRLAKQSIDLGIETTLEAGLEIERLCYQETLGTSDRIEGLEAFKEKRKPQYTGK